MHCSHVDGAMHTQQGMHCAVNLRGGMGIGVGASEGMDDFFDAFGFDANALQVHANWRKCGVGGDGVECTRAEGAERSVIVGGRKYADTIATGPSATVSEKQEKESDVHTDALDMLADALDMHALLPHSNSAHADSTRTGDADTAPAPLDQQRLPRCYYLHGLFDDSFLDLLAHLAEELPGERICVKIS